MAACHLTEIHIYPRMVGQGMTSYFHLVKLVHEQSARIVDYRFLYWIYFLHLMSNISDYQSFAPFQALIVRDCTPFQTLICCKITPFQVIMQVFYLKKSKY